MSPWLHVLKSWRAHPPQMHCLIWESSCNLCGMTVQRGQIKQPVTSGHSVVMSCHGDLQALVLQAMAGAQIIR